MLGQEDGEAVLQRLRAKEARGEGLTAGDRIDMVLLPLMRHHRPLEDVLREVAQVAQRLPRAQQEETIGAMVGLAYHYVDEGVSAALLEALRMSNALEALLDETVAKGLAQGLEQGMQQGEASGERRLLRKYLQQRFGAIPAPLDAVIERADAEALTAMFDRALVSENVTALLDDTARTEPNAGAS